MLAKYSILERVPRDPKTEGPRPEIGKSSELLLATAMNLESLRASND